MSADAIAPPRAPDVPASAPPFELPDAPAPAPELEPSPLHAFTLSATNAVNQSSLECLRGVMGSVHGNVPAKPLKVHTRSCHAAAH